MSPTLGQAWADEADRTVDGIAGTLRPGDHDAVVMRHAEKGAYRVVVGRHAKVMDWLTRLVPGRAMTMTCRPNGRPSSAPDSRLIQTIRW
jgi:hypothetical protein